MLGHEQPEGLEECRGRRRHFPPRCGSESENIDDLCQLLHSFLGRICNTYERLILENKKNFDQIRSGFLNVKKSNLDNFVGLTKSRNDRAQPKKKDKIKIKMYLTGKGSTTAQTRATALISIYFPSSIAICRAYLNANCQLFLELLSYRQRFH